MQGPKDTPSGLRNAKRIFVSALEHAPLGLEDYLERVCGQDVGLRARVERLLEAHGQASSKLDRAPALPAINQGEELGPGDVVGNYQIDGELGQGGFGRVFLAQQLRPVRRAVALKVIKLGMDTRQVISRFEAERQTLALMDHPNIAGVLDGGTTASGRPYFVMEFVPGRPITDYCRKKRLGLIERVQLVRKICSAIQHAHVKGVLHRDIKPSNVLVVEVDGVPEPRVIDFGIAKAIGEEASPGVTVEGTMIGTPIYMSPEQVGFEADIDTRSDVHALGILLYELMIGRSPFANESDEVPDLELVRHRVLNVDPEPPRRAAQRGSSSVMAELPRELDWIILRCLEKDRERRYSSAAALGEDLGRFLAHEPLEAAPPNKAYRFQKLVRRHRAAAVGVVAVALALMLGAVGTIGGLVQARVESKEARLQAEIATAVNEFLNDDLLSAVKPSNLDGAGWDVSMSEVLDAAAARLEEAAAPGGRFERAPRIEASLRQTLGSTYQALGRPTEAEPHFERALEIHRAELGPDHRDTLLASGGLVSVSLSLGRYEECIERARALWPRFTACFGEDSREVAALATGKGHALRRIGDFEEAARVYREAIARAEKRGDAGILVTLALEGALGIAEDALGNSAEAERLMRRAYEGRLRETGADDVDTLASMQNLGGFLWGEGRLKEARPLLEGALEGLARVEGPEHPATLKAKFNLAGIYRESGELDRAEELLLATHEVCAARFGEDHLDTIQALGGLARLAEERMQFEEAEAVYTEAIERCTEAHGWDNPTTAKLRKDLAACILFQGRLREARTLFEELLPDEVELFGECHGRTITTLVNLTSTARRLADLVAAEYYGSRLLACTEGLIDGTLRRQALEERVIR